MSLQDKPERKIRVIVAKPGLDGHDRGVKIVAATLRDAGMEVIYAGLRQTPKMIVSAAIQEDVDAIGLSVLSGAHMVLFRETLELMREHGCEHILLFGGGIIPKEDVAALRDLGVGELFLPGTSSEDYIRYLREEIGRRRAARDA
jgi:methylmalonyl-CoA mutase C-terminal domain/subunit